MATGICPGGVAIRRTSAEVRSQPPGSFAIGHIAVSGWLAAIVPLLMLTTFLAQFALFFVNQWTTVLLTSDGIPVQRAAYATGAFQVFGFLGALAVTRPVDRFGFLPVPILFAAAAAVIAAMGIPGLGETAIIALAGAAGFCVIGLQFGNIATTGQVFPTNVRSGGVGLVYGVGRIGSFVGPGLAGILVGLYQPALTPTLRRRHSVMPAEAGIHALFRRQSKTWMAGRPLTRVLARPP
jgi:MFS family permease